MTKQHHPIIQVINALILFPCIALLLFSGINYIITILFALNWMQLQQSPIWILWAIIVIVLDGVYLTEQEKLTKND